MAGRDAGGMLTAMGRTIVHPGSTASLRGFRCSACGYGAARESTPHRCPMCGGTRWDEERLRPYVSLSDDLAIEAEDEEANAPLQREASEFDSLGILPGVPFS